ncbi:hypothetical protein AAE485_00050 [Acidithiobacillus ferriphilus]|uniref:type II toxin-antitoxin system RelE/ParE family toxin n=1 Tax=Acidithiobacillus ferriphilus TaxID=1689834 RepID=UPI00390C85F6
MISIKTTATFDRWLHGLRDRRARVRVQVRIDRMELAHFGDCELVVLLAGGDKSTQSADIALALKLARQMEG